MRSFFSSFLSIYKSEILKLWNLQKGKCVLTGFAMDIKVHSIYQVTIDRIMDDEKIDYVEGHVRLICDYANIMKMNKEDNILKKFSIAICDTERKKMTTKIQAAYRGYLVRKVTNN